MHKIYNNEFYGPDDLIRMRHAELVAQADHDRLVRSARRSQPQWHPQPLATALAFIRAHFAVRIQSSKHYGHS